MKSDKLTICTFIDAYGWELFQRKQILQDELQQAGPLQTVLGYSSACDPTILTGLLLASLHQLASRSTVGVEPPPVGRPKTRELNFFSRIFSCDLIGWKFFDLGAHKLQILKFVRANS